MSDTETQLYVIRHEHGYVKIGKSNDPEERVKYLQTACPYELEVFTTFTVKGDWQAVESAIHETYREYGVRGEWFNLPVMELVYLTELTTVYSESVVKDDEWTPKNYVRNVENRRERWILAGDFEVAP